MPGQQPRPCRSSPDCGRRRPRARRKSWPWYTGPRVSKRSAGGGAVRIALELALAQRRERRGGRCTWSGPRRTPAPRRPRDRRRRADRRADRARGAGGRARRRCGGRGRTGASARAAGSRDRGPGRARAAGPSERPRGAADARASASADAPLRLARSRSAAEAGRLGRSAPPAAASCCASAPTARNSGSGSSCSVALSSFSSLTVRSPNFARYSRYCSTNARWPVERGQDLVDSAARQPQRSARRAAPARRASRCMRTAGSALTMPPSPPIRSFCSVPSGSPHQRVTRLPQQRRRRSSRRNR